MHRHRRRRHRRAALQLRRRVSVGNPIRGRKNPMKEFRRRWRSSSSISDNKRIEGINGVRGDAGGPGPGAGAGAGAGAGEEVAARAAHKRYEGLMTVRTKAIKGKGAWYWAHLEPILVQSSDTGLPKAVKLRCSLCDAVFSASNPSRTASEHLKRGSCPNFTSPSPSSSAPGPPLPLPAAPHLLPAPSLLPLVPSAPQQRHRRRQQHRRPQANLLAARPHRPLAALSPSNCRRRRRRSRSRHVLAAAVVSNATIPAPPPPAPAPAPSAAADGDCAVGREGRSGRPADAGGQREEAEEPQDAPRAGAPQGAGRLRPRPPGRLVLRVRRRRRVLHLLRRPSQIPRLPPQPRPAPALPPRPRRPQTRRALRRRPRRRRRPHPRRPLLPGRLRRLEPPPFSASAAAALALPLPAAPLVSLTVNLPNGTSVFHRAIPVQPLAPSKFAEEVLWDAVLDVSGPGNAQRCAGIVADRFKSKALRSLEGQHHWMVNLSCLLRAFHCLLRDLFRELPLFRTAAANSAKLAAYFNTNRRADDPAAAGAGSSSFFCSVFAMLEDVLASARALQLAIHDESYKLACLEDPVARETAEMIRDMGFWNDLEAAHELMKLVRDAIRDAEAERPLVGQCLPLWEQLRAKVKDWCAKFGADEAHAGKVLDRRFKKTYHPAWSAAFILDPLYLVKDASGKYLPQFKSLTPEQEKDVDKLITRMVSREEAHIALMELMKWRTEGLDPLYAQAVQVKQLDPATGKMKIANPQSSRLVWETCLSEFKSLGKVAVRLIFLHATSCGVRWNLSPLRSLAAHGRSRASVDRAHKLVFVAAHSKLERRDFSNDEDKDLELFTNGDDDVLSETSPFAEASSL
uniref:DUF7963 domain-containing protein n=1 Tax=Ananas comosus var. bracteatus TaxID=296719 RepID=A0A6V7PXN7_ANACO|nr:unnamed protein product [Ananas comosus var. bracteatus]